MPRYFFHVRDGDSSPDAEGTELPDLCTARIEAVKLSGAMLKENAEKFWTGESWQMNVHNGEGEQLFTLVF